MPTTGGRRWTGCARIRQSFVIRFLAFQGSSEGKRERRISTESGAVPPFFDHVKLCFRLIV